jgi:hypothetical protein
MTKTKEVTVRRYLEPDSPIAYVRELQSLRRHCIRSQSRCDRSIEALIARSIGYRSDLDEKERARLYKTAMAVRLKIEKDATEGAPFDDPRIPPGVVNMTMTSLLSRSQWDRERVRIEDDMIDVAKLLPVWPWVRSVAGVGPLGLAVLVGEAGDVGSYSGPGRLWKRLGLACIDGQRQGTVSKEITGEARKEAWKQRGYNPARRAEVWAFIDDVMFRAQWRGDKDVDGKDPKKTGKPVETPARGIGPYGIVYGERKEWNLARGLALGHADRDARRFMAKRFIRDLWVAWRTAETVREEAA